LHEGLDFRCERSVSVGMLRRAEGPIWILPRWPCRHCGASVVTAP